MALIKTLRFLNRAVLLVALPVALLQDYAAAQSIPPPGIKIPAGDRLELELGIAQLGKEIDELRQTLKARPALLKLLPDVQIFHNAVRYPLEYDEFYDVKEVAVARQMLQRGLERARELRDGKPSWPAATGLVVRGYKSRLDDSVQPYGLVVPAAYHPAAAQRFRLDFWCHGRGEKLTELSFLDGRLKNPGEFTPPGAFVLHLYGRYCNANRFAGEVDLFEALEHMRKHYPIDPDRLVIRGFSMGGAACWQFATHHPSMWAAAAPGAGFAEAAEFLDVYKKEKVPPTPWQEKLWRWYNATDYALNLFNCPTVAYSGAIDKQKQAADAMARALATQGMTLTHIIGPNTAHKYHPDSKVEINKLIDAIVAKGRERVPKQMKFTTFTLRYNRSYWVEIDRLEKHWERAQIEASIVDATQVAVKASGMRAFTLTMAAGECPLALGKPIKVTIDGQDFEAAPVNKDRSWSSHFLKIKGGKWAKLDARYGSLFDKRPGLQGPIDDAFMDRFIIVRPTGKSKWPAIDRWVAAEMERAVKHWRSQFRGEPIVKDDVDVTESDVKTSNLVLWGDPHSNKLLFALGNRYDMIMIGDLYYLENEKVEKGEKDWYKFQLGRDNFVLGKGYDADKHVPVMICPNPMNRNKYVVLNSGFTFRDYDYLNNARQSPKLPEWAVVDVTVAPDGRNPGRIVDAGFFDESWSVPSDARVEELVAASGSYTVHEWKRWTLGTENDGYRLICNDGTFMALSVHPKENARITRRTPTTYYHLHGPIGLVMSKLTWFTGDPFDKDAHPAEGRLPAEDARLPAALVGMGWNGVGISLPVGQLAGIWSEPPVAVVGINAGTPAAYARPYQFFDFYDRDGSALPFSLPAADQKPYFLFLGDARQRGAKLRFFIGPERQGLKEKAPRHFYHALLIDTIRQEVNKPIKELLTKEAIASYFDLLVQDGVVCIATGNRDWNLVPVVADVVQSLGWHCKVLEDYGGGHDGHKGSQWVIIARKAEFLAYTQLAKTKGFNLQLETPSATGTHVWTDKGPNALEPLSRPWLQLPLRLHEKKSAEK